MTSSARVANIENEEPGCGGPFLTKRADGAAQEANLPSRGLHDLTGFEDRLGHRAHAAPPSTVA